MKTVAEVIGVSRSNKLSISVAMITSLIFWFLMTWAHNVNVSLHFGDLPVRLARCSR
jgi:hypothetical protein